MAKRAPPKQKSAQETTGALTAYRAKRDFAKTPEPQPEPQGGASLGAARLVIQRHYARREHFDLRLEMDGVLKSWAVTRGPSANPHDKRLAVRTEDHPLDYGGFEGLIPKGEYGGGTVTLWEDTTYAPLNGDPLEALEKGEIKFLSHGARLRGRWVLVCMKTQEKHDNWLLIKERDEFSESDDGLARRFDVSVATGRTRDEIERGVPAKRRAPPKGRAKAAVWSEKRIATSPTPPFITPQLCETVETPPTGEGWLFELKYDGYRLQLATGAQGARCFTRAGLDWTARFPGLARAAFALPCRNALLDGEAVVFDKSGLSDFAALVAALEAGDQARVEFIAFDLLRLDDEDLRTLSLRARKQRLRKLLTQANGAIRYAADIEGEGAAVFAQATSAGAEGIIAKRADAPYRSGRYDDWLKIKGDYREEVRVIGFMPSDKGESFASLLAAKETPDGLFYVGRIGTGYDARKRAMLARLLARRVKTAPSIGAAEKLPKSAIYLETPFAVQTRFGGWTMDGQMRQARFLGVREDIAPPLSAKRPREGKSGGVALAAVTHAERVVFPDDGVTKGDIAAYYQKIAARIAPHLHDRVVSLIRAPQNIDAQLFFQRHPLKGMTKGVLTVTGEREPYMALDGALGLHTAAQFGAIELHGWMARRDDLDHPDRMVFDLDPAEDVAFAQVKKAAVDLRDHLAAIGLQSWPMLTGGKGVHVVLPLDRSLAFGETEPFAAGFARGMAGQAPKRFVATMSKKLRQGRIFIDWLRNKKSATAILPWSLRARRGAPVAVPVSWATLAKTTSASAYDIRSAPDAPSDGWTGFFETRQTIPAGALSFLKKASA